MKFPTDTPVKVTEKEFIPLMEALVTTIENHLKFVEDDETEQVFTELVHNGIRKHETLTVTAVAHILNMTDKKFMQAAPVISKFFETVPVLSLYWTLTKLNVHSFYIKKIENENIKDLIDNMDRLDNEPPKSEPKQTTMTQHMLTPPRVKTTVAKLDTPGITADSATPMASYTTEKDDGSGFILPRKTVSATAKRDFSNVSPTMKSSNMYDLLGDEVDDDISFDQSSKGDHVHKTDNVPLIGSAAKNVNLLSPSQFANISQMIRDGKQDDVDTTDLEQWINSKVTQVVNDQFEQVTATYTWKKY